MREFFTKSAVTVRITRRYIHGDHVTEIVNNLKLVLLFILTVII